MMDSQQQRDVEESEEAKPQREERLFDPWEQTFNRDFQKRDRAYEF